MFEVTAPLFPFVADNLLKIESFPLSTHVLAHTVHLADGTPRSTRGEPDSLTGVGAGNQKPDGPQVAYL